MSNFSYLDTQVEELEAKLAAAKVARDMAKAREGGGEVTYAYTAAWPAGRTFPVIRYVKGKRYMSDATGVFILLLENDPLERVVNVLEASESYEEDSAVGYHATKQQALVALGRRLVKESELLAVRQESLELQQADLVARLERVPSVAEQLDLEPEQ